LKIPRPAPAGRLPAFGRELLELRRRGLVPKRHLFLGHVRVLLDNWRWGRVYDGRMPKLIVPEDSDPRELSFAMLAGLDVTAVWSLRYSTSERFGILRDALLAAGINGLQVFQLDCAPSRDTWYVIRPGRGEAA